MHFKLVHSVTLKLYAMNNVDAVTTVLVSVIGVSEFNSECIICWFTRAITTTECDIISKHHKT